MNLKAEKLIQLTFLFLFICLLSLEFLKITNFILDKLFYRVTPLFADLITIIVRSIHFYKLGVIDIEIFTIGSFLGIMCLFGTYIGKKIVDKIGKKVHQTLIEFFMLSGSIIMIIRALTLD